MDEEKLRQAKKKYEKIPLPILDDKVIYKVAIDEKKLKQKNSDTESI